jgi:hypothetical protein
MERFSIEQFGEPAWEKQDGEHSFVRASLCYAANGWPVTPMHWIDNEKCSCGSKCKRPGCHCQQESYVFYKPARVRWMWDNLWPEANLGIATGDPSGIIAVHEYHPRGRKHIGSLKPPPTWCAQAGESIVYYFRQPIDLVFCVGGLDILPGVDIHGHNSFAIVPPSIHQFGAEYSWVTPEGLPLADCPASVIKLIEGRKKR